MDEILVSENPRKKQRSHRRRARRNPEVLAIGNPRKKRSRRRRAKKFFRFSMTARRNPGFGGKIPILGYPVSSLMYLAVGATGTSFLSGMVAKWVPFLQPDPAKANQSDFFERTKPYLIDLVAAFGTAKLAGMAFRSKQAENEVLTGGLAVPLLRLLRTEVFPKIGLSGPDDFDEADFMGMGYFAERNGIGAFLPEPGDDLLGGRDVIRRRRSILPLGRRIPQSDLLMN